MSGIAQSRRCIAAFAKCMVQTGSSADKTDRVLCGHFDKRRGRRVQVSWRTGRPDGGLAAKEAAYAVEGDRSHGSTRPFHCRRAGGSSR